MEAKKLLYSLRQRREFFPYVIFFVGIFVTFAVAIYLNTSSIQDDWDRFNSAATRTKESIINRTDTYIALLRAGAGLFAGSENVTKDEFQAFSDTSGLYKKYYGVQGIVYARRIPNAQKAAIIDNLYANGVTDFSIRPELPNRPEYYAIAYFEPQDNQNQKAIGFDIFTDPIQKVAMEKARDSGNVQSTKKLTLAEGDDYRKQPGIIMYVPIYRKGALSNTTAQRRENIDGFIYSPFRTYDLLQSIYQSEHSEDIRLAVYEGDTITEKKFTL